MSRKRNSAVPTAGSATQRQLRVGEELRHALAEILRHGELRDPALQDASITVTEVRVSPDLRNATAFVMPLGGADVDIVIPALRRSAPFLKGVVARTLPLRRAPSLAFALDSSFDEAGRIASLLASPEVKRDLEPADASDEDGG
jgi:ribosome-binding factor A